MGRSTHSRIPVEDPRRGVPARVEPRRVPGSVAREVRALRTTRPPCTTCR
ncbi:hypothetical protein FM103_06325 [Corynebacterium xerosis]|nr:hypothetical protein FM103_06325 [Corynebacterium xerosis]